MTEKMGSTRRTVRIVCDAESHAPKVANVQRFQVITYDDGHVSVSPHGAVNDKMPESVANLDELDVPIPASEFGTSRVAPHGRALGREKRQRYALECPLCGLRVVLRQESAERLAVALATRHVSRVTLSAVAASL